MSCKIERYDACKIFHLWKYKVWGVKSVILQQNLKNNLHETFSFNHCNYVVGQVDIFAQTQEQQNATHISLKEIGQNENNIRNIGNAPIECWYIPTSNSFLFNSFSLISNVEVTIENLTTGELIQEEYSVIAGQVSIPAISTKGTFVIELIINDNEDYINTLV